eukprot:1280552-Amphidinium_carterae.1
MAALRSHHEPSVRAFVRRHVHCKDGPARPSFRVPLPPHILQMDRVTTGQSNRVHRMVLRCVICGSEASATGAYNFRTSHGPGICDQRNLANKRGRKRARRHPSADAAPSAAPPQVGTRTRTQLTRLETVVASCNMPSGSTLVHGIAQHPSLAARRKS